MTELIWEGKYGPDGRKTAPVRLALPFQDVETVNESAKTRNLVLDMFARNQPSEWRNRLIWGDKKYVLPSLLPEFAGKVDLIYIDPPFATGADFSFSMGIPNDPNSDENQETRFVKQPSMIEQKAYRDTWGRGLDSYLQWFSETAVLLHHLLAETGSLYVHLDWHIGHYAKIILDEIFGFSNFRNQIVWTYKKLARSSSQFPKSHDIILFYSKTANNTFNVQYVELSASTIKRWGDRMRGGKDPNERYATDEQSLGAVMPDTWEIPLPIGANPQKTGYPTQKPTALLERVIKASSNEGDLVLDCFIGSGTTVAVAESLSRRWIAADLGRFAIHTTRKRLLSFPDVRPFVVQNLGKYERQAWQAAEFGSERDRLDAAQARYRRFILDLYGAEELTGFVWLHGVRAGRFVHVGSVDAPVVESDIKAIAREFWQATGKGTGAKSNSVDILGWDFAFELNEMGKQMAADANIGLSFKRIPREVLEKKAVEQGDIRFFELAALDLEQKWAGRRNLSIALRDFVVPPDDIPADVQSKITHWSQLIDYWAVDWDFRGDTFHNQWQSYRSKKQPKLELAATHEYDALGRFTVLVKVIDILGNDTTKSLTVEVE